MQKIIMFFSNFTIEDKKTLKKTNDVFFKQSLFVFCETFYKKERLKNLFYKCIFFGLAALFMELAFLIFFKSPNFISGVYFKNYALVMKDGITTICLFFGIAAFISGYSVHPKKKSTAFKNLNKSTYDRFRHVSQAVLLTIHVLELHQ